MGYVATGGAIESTVRDELIKNMPLIFSLVQEAAAETTIYKRSFDFGDINTIKVYYESHEGGANLSFKLDIGGVNKITSSDAAGKVNHSVDCSAITGNNILEIKVDTQHALDTYYYSDITITAVGA